MVREVVATSVRSEIFVHVPKCGGNSIISIWERRLVVVNHNIREPAHRPLAKIREQFPKLPTFGFVRNPWDRILSAYCYLGAGGRTGVLVQRELEFWPGRVS
jgi:hypothetical protein